MNPDVSIIIFCYNQTKYISEAIQSILAQTFTNWELLVSDNGSIDGTQEKIKNFIHDPRIKLLLNDKNETITKRYKEALSKTRGNFISILYGDDFYMPEKIEKQLGCFENLSKEWGVVHGPGLTLNQSDGKKVLDSCTKVHGEALKDLLVNYYDGFINPISPLVRSECFRIYPSYQDLFVEAECLYFKFALTYKFFYLDDPLVVMRQHDTNMRWFSKRNSEVLDTCLERLPTFKEFPKKYSDLLLTMRVKALTNSAWQNIRLGIDSNWARSKLISSFRLSFFQSFSIRNLISLSLTLMPNFLVIWFNQLINILFRRTEQIYIDEPYQKKE